MDRRAPPPMPIRRGRAVYVCLLAAFAAAALVGMVAGDWSALGYLHVPVMDQPWLDARAVSGAAVAIEHGVDPLVANPGDPAGRPLNYPRAWLVLAAWGVGPEQTWLLAWAFFGGALVGLMTLVPLVRSVGSGVVLALAVFAPTTWLAIERGNSDLMMFALCAVAAWQFAARPVAATALIHGAAFLKLYPVAAVAGLLSGDVARRRLLVGTLALFAVYVVAIRGDIGLMHASTPRAASLAYGIETLPMLVAKNALVSFGLVLGLAGMALAVTLAAAYRRRLRGRIAHLSHAHAVAAFRIGSGVYLGTFLMGQSFDYRLLFLVLVLPQLWAWATKGGPRVRGLAVLLIGAVLLMQWSLTWRAGIDSLLVDRRVGLMVDEILSWALWMGLAWLLVQTLPDWCVPASARERSGDGRVPAPVRVAIRAPSPSARTIPGR